MSYKGYTNRETYTANACINSSDQDRGYWASISKRCTRRQMIDKMKRSYSYWVGHGLFDVSPEDADKIDWEQIANEILSEVV